jgi:hypothetical protein
MESITTRAQAMPVSIVITIRRMDEADTKKFAGGFSLDSGHW